MATITATVGKSRGALEITVENPDRAALVALYNATDGPNWLDKTNWLTDAPLSQWKGVETQAGRVTWLELSWNNLTGSIPAEVGNLAHLQSLFLYSNYLTGPIPPELGNLTRLIDLELQENNLTGPIPAELGNLAHLQTLWLASNDLTGHIPPELGQLTNLEVLSLSDNALTGHIPPELGNLAHLQGLSLSVNALTGHIPPELGQLTNLQGLSLSFNALTGHIPPELGQLTNLEELSLWVNSLTGHIPPELGQLTNLEVLFLSDNALTGHIPPELGNLAHLRSLHLNANDLIGHIPPELGQLTNLEELSLSDNALTGHIPPEVLDLTRPDISLPAGVCILKKQLARAVELRISGYECESDGRLLPSALMREDSNGLSIALPDDLLKLQGMTISDPSVVAASVADGWLELTPRGIGTAQVELVPSDGGESAVAEVVVRSAVGTFGIDIVMERPAPLTYAEALMSGADWWSRVLDGTEWPDRRAECPDHDSFNDKFKAMADELLVLATVDDSPGATGYALICFRSLGTQVALDPGGGAIAINSGGSNPYLVVHEIGHILGLVLWGPETGLVSEDGAYFIGPLAVEAFRASGGDPYLPGVPIDDAHWGYGVNDFLDGAISVAALADAGYTVAVTDPAPPSWR